MTRVEITKARKLKKKDFNRNYLKKYCKFLGYTTLVILGAIAWIHLLVGAVIGSYKDIEDNEYNVYLIDRGGLKTKYQVRGFDNIYQVIIDHWWDYKDENSQRGNAD